MTVVGPGPQIIHVPAGVGIDQTKRAEHVQPGEANLYQQNVRLDYVGGLIQRPGFTNLTSLRFDGSSRTAGKRVASHRNEMVVSDGDLLDVYSPTAGVWATKGRLPACTVKRVKVASYNIQNDNMYDVTYSNGYYVIVCTEPYSSTAGTINVLGIVVDASNGLVIYTQTLLASPVAATTCQSVKIVAVGTNVVAMFTNAGTIKGCRMDMTNVAAGFAGQQNVAANYKNTNPYNHGVFDAVGLTTRVAIAYENTVGSTTRISIVTFDPTVNALTNISTQLETTTNTNVSEVAIAGAEGEEIWTTWAHDTVTNVFVSARNTTTLASIIATATAFNTLELFPQFLAIGRTASHEVYISASSIANVILSGSWYRTTTTRAFNSGGSLVTDSGFPSIAGWIAYSKPFRMNGRVYMEFAYDDVLTQPNVVLGDITGDTASTALNLTVRPIGWAAPRLSRFDNLGFCITARHACFPTATKMASLRIVKANVSAASLSIIEHDFASPLNQLPKSFAESLYISGGIQYQYDGQRVYEAGFIVGPRVDLTLVGSGSLTGTYIYTAIYEFIDAFGNVIFSEPAPVMVKSPSAQNVTIVVRQAMMTWKNGNDPNTKIEPKELRTIRIRLYRTATGGGTFYNIANFATRDTSISYTDSLSDTALIALEQLYTIPGTVGASKNRQAMGAVQHIVECNGVLVAIGDDGTTLRCTAQHVVGESPWHHDNLQIPIEGDGDVIALASQDGAVIAFKRDAIFVVPVDPASNNLSTGGFGVPRRLAVDIGCINPRSVVVTGLGVFFQSDRGIEILTRSLAVNFIGQQIQTTFPLYPNVMAAVLDVQNAIVRFSLAQTGSTTVGVDAVYDLTVQAWSSFDVKTGAAASAQAVSASYVFHAGAWRYVWLDSVGTIRFEDPTTWLDSGAWVIPQWETAWIKTELQREHQFWQADLLFERESAAGLLGEVAYDWQPYSASDNKVWSEAEIATFSRQVEPRLSGRHQAVKFRFSGTAPAILGTGRGLTFIGVSIDLEQHQGPTQGTPKLAVASRK